MPSNRTRPKLKKPSNADWGMRLSGVLKEKGVSLRKAAKIAGVATSVIDSWTSGASPGDHLALRKLCDHLDISFAWVLTGAHEGNHKPTLMELYEVVPYFDGLARIRIDRLVPRGSEGTGEDK